MPNAAGRNEKLRADIKRMHEKEGLSYRAIGKKLGLSKTRVQTLVREMRLAPHPRHRPRPRKDADAA